MKFRSVLPVGVVAIMLPALAACGSSSGDDTAAPGHSAKVTVTAADGCTIDNTTLAAGAINFSIENKDATGVTEIELLSDQRIVGEKENLPPGFSGGFAVNVPAGQYTLYCPGASTERVAITVTGEAAAASTDNADLAKQATEGYSKYVSTQVGYLLAAVKDLNTALHGTDLAAAQRAYAQARPFYEKIEPVAESFTIGDDDLDAAIDARADEGVSPTELTGFHRIEYGLFEVKSLNGLGPIGDGLVSNVAKLQQKVDGLTYQPFELANGAQGLLDEVAASKITGEEERYSHIDMLDFANNDEGAEQAFAQLTPLLMKIDPELTKTIQKEFAALDKLVDTYRDANEPSGYKLYTALTAKDKQQLAAAIKAVQEPLSRVANKVAN